MSDHFHRKQSREAVDLRLTCHPSPSLTTFAFRSSEVRRLLLDLDPYGGTDPLGMFPLFLTRTADVMAPRFSVVFRRLVRLGSFPACWRQANVTQFRKVHRPVLLPLLTNFHNISIVKVFERLVSVSLGRFMERSDVLPTTQLAYRKDLDNYNALLCMSHTLQSALESE